MGIIIQLRRDTIANWASVNPILAQGEKGYETESLGSVSAKYKIGDGVSAWNVLPYQLVGGSGDMEKSTYDVGNTGVVDNAEKVNNLTVETAVPSGALFTDTIKTDSEVKISLENNADTNTVTDAEKVVIGNTSGTNTGDQDLSGKQNILSEGAFVNGDKTKLSGIDAGAEVNTINSKTAGEPTGSDVVLNVVSLTQSEYDAGAKVATTIYNITDA